MHKEWEMKNWQREQMPRKWRGKGSEEDRHCDGDYIKSDLERMRGEWRKMPTEGIVDCKLQFDSGLVTGHLLFGNGEFLTKSYLNYDKFLCDKCRTGKENLTQALFYPPFFVTLLIRQPVIGPPFHNVLVFRDWGHGYVTH